ncbi:hypothetical protein BV394_07245 [Brevirhabdus pacifica]|uniref:Uncharacterized protein n=1 Tax=Brevirhabdus pacifica TaxID=1267768 RepID=A0A1U7DHY0_9RHOB|nr:hypothetical protein [Brevirhabdus pacifica]APX89535.1 hypothetical protein BV394_07245 [Brevirhabdus pacifica]OWU76459.1 hypothetical protein ATO5_09055 [Loktanella sp. 22II-4b]PJJ85808.1 hypothetical protein CLV77_0337 [Brevirhabdus pacifica]
MLPSFLAYAASLSRIVLFFLAVAVGIGLSSNANGANGAFCQSVTPWSEVDRVICAVSPARILDLVL